MKEVIKMTTYVKYILLLNGHLYREIFKDHFSAAYWLDDCEYDGDTVVVLSSKNVTANDVLVDEDFTENYRHEIALEMVDDNAYKYNTYEAVDARLKELGYL